MEDETKNSVCVCSMYKDSDTSGLESGVAEA